MTQLTLRPIRVSAVLFATAVLMGSGPSALAQQPDPRQPTPQFDPPKPRNATSDLDATAPSPQEQRETRSLAAAVFAKPAAAARAADKAAPPQPDLNIVQAKPEWSTKEGLQVGDKGVEFKSPF